MRDPFADVNSLAWQDFFATQRALPYYDKLLHFLDEAYASHQVFPPFEDIANAFRLTPLEEVKVVLLGQDPYHDEGQAHGLAFSVQNGMKIPPSLRNIFKELSHDISVPFSQQSNLSAWAKQGVLLINSVLTVQAHKAGSHQNQGWEHFTQAIVHYLSQKCEYIVFILWGAQAIKKAALIDEQKHCIITSAHPSPLSAYRGFFNSKPFSRTNDYLKSVGKTPIDWRL